MINWILSLKKTKTKLEDKLHIMRCVKSSVRSHHMDPCMHMIRRKQIKHIIYYMN